MAVEDGQRFRWLASAFAEECAKRGVRLNQARAEDVVAERLRLHAERAHTDEARILRERTDDGWPRRLASVFVRGGAGARRGGDGQRAGGEPARTYGPENVCSLLDAVTAVVAIAVASAEHADRAECELAVVSAAACASGLGAAIRTSTTSDVVVAGATVRMAREVIGLAAERVAAGAWRTCWCGDPAHLTEDPRQAAEQLQVDLLLVR